MKTFLAGFLLALCVAPSMASAQAPAAPATSAAWAPPANSILLTVFLRHDQSKTSDEINAHLGRQASGRTFRPRAWKS